MEINYEELEKMRGEDVVKITALTETHGSRSIDDCLEEAIIELNDGEFYRLVTSSEDKKAATSALLDLLYRAHEKQNWEPNSNGTYDEFEQLEVHGKNGADERYESVLDEYYAFVEEQVRNKRIRKAVGVGAGIGTLTVGGLVGCGVVKDKFKDGEEPEVQLEQTIEETVNEKPEIKGTSWEFYVENAPESFQKDFYVNNFYPAFDTLNARLAEHTYTSESGVFGRLGLTVQQARLLYLILHNYSDEQIAQIMGGQLFNQIPMFDNDGNPVLDEHGNQVMEDSTVVIQQAFEVFQQWFKDAPLTSEDINAVTSFFDTEHDKEIVRKFINGHNAMLNATTDKEREDAAKAQRALYDDIFASDITDSDTKVSDEATAFISRTMYVADTEFCMAYDYTGTELIYKAGTDDRVEVETVLFGPQFDAWFRSGMQDFDSENYIKRTGYNPDKYYVNKSSEVMSITDATCEYLYGKIVSANEYIRDLQNSDVEFTNEQQLELIRQKLETKESLTEDDFNQIRTMDVVSKMDQLTENTYPVVDIEELIRVKMKSIERYPVHTEVFAEKWSKIVQEIKDKLSANYKDGGSGSKKTGVGSNPKTFNNGTMEQNRAAASQELQNRGATAAQAEAMLNKAEEEANKKQGILGKDNAETAKKAQEEANKRTQENQVKYDEVWKYAYNWYSQNGGSKGTPAQEGAYLANTTSIDSNDKSGKVRVCDAYQAGKEAGIGYYNNQLVARANSGDQQALEEARKLGLITGGDTVIDNGLGDYIQDGSLGTDGGGTTVEDVVDQNRGQAGSSDKPTVTPGDGVVPPPEDTENGGNSDDSNADDNEDDKDDELPDGFIPIVDGEGTGGETEIWSPDEIIDQIDKLTKSQSTTVSVSDDVLDQAIDAVAADIVEESGNSIGGNVVIDDALLEYISGDVSMDADLENEVSSSYTR